MAGSGIGSYGASAIAAPFPIFTASHHAARLPRMSRPSPRLAESSRTPQRTRVRLPACPEKYPTRAFVRTAYTHSVCCARPPCQAKPVHASALDARCALKMAQRRAAGRRWSALLSVQPEPLHAAVRDAHALSPSQAVGLVDRSVRRALRAARHCEPAHTTPLASPRAPCPDASGCAPFRSSVDGAIVVPVSSRHHSKRDVRRGSVL
ncbi:hypothetical protein K438DRAFT_1979297 [Mycena galopus ATCC 62051]|nr:hypothetical protein K438DRAFT_1979297 [Mycena galopus ATCC 62051]